MAEPLSLVSGLLSLVSFAYHSVATLHDTINSFQSQRQDVRDLEGELNALAKVLSSLTTTSAANNDIPFSTLSVPLSRCDNACKGFQEEVLRYAPPSMASRASFRDWAKLRYMGEDIDGFRRLLSGYKVTISIAIADAHLRASSHTLETIETYSDMVSTSRADLEDRLRVINEKLDSLFGQGEQSPLDGPEVRPVEEERLNTEGALQICTQLSEHISQIQLLPMHSTSRTKLVGPAFLPERIINDCLQLCQSSLYSTASKLKEHEDRLLERSMELLKTSVISQEGPADLSWLREECEAIRSAMEISSKVNAQLKENMSAGDAIQYLVPTNEKTIFSKNRGLGWRTRQFGGQMSDDLLQHIARTLALPSISRSRHSNTVRDVTIGTDAVQSVADTFNSSMNQASQYSPPLATEPAISKEPEHAQFQFEDRFADRIPKNDIETNSQNTSSMANSLSITASSLAVVTAAVKSTKTLYATAKCFKDRDKTLRRLQDEVGDLTSVLDSLRRVADAEDPMLKLLQGPVERCDRLCGEFEQAMVAFSGKTKTGIRDWAKIEFMRGDINEFMDNIAGYKSTILVGLGIITLHTSKVSQQVLQEYTEVIKDTVYTLELHLGRINERMTQISHDNTNASSVGIDLGNERAVAKQCLRICADANAHIEFLSNGTLYSTHDRSESVLDRIPFGAQVRTRQVLKEHRDSFAETIGYLRRRLEILFPDEGPRDETERSRLLSDIEISKQCLDICKEASEVSRPKANKIGEVISNSEGDQAVVTTLADLFDAKKAASKPTSAQLVGSMKGEELWLMTEQRYGGRFGWHGTQETLLT